MNNRTMYISAKRESIGVTDIGLLSLHCAGLATLETGVIHATFHCLGTIPVENDWLSNKVSGAANAGAPSRRNHAGIASNPAADVLRWSSILNVSFSVRRSSQHRLDNLCDKAGVGRGYRNFPLRVKMIK